MAETFKQLGQARENSTNPASVYSPGASTQAIIKAIYICNQSGADATFRVFVDDDGSTYDQTSCLVYDETIPADSTTVLTDPICMNDATGNLAYRSSVANALTCTVFGVEIT